MQDKWGWLERHQKTAAFAVTFCMFLALHHIENIQLFPWDSGDYWDLSEIHKLLNFPKFIRGYFYPLLLAPSRYVFDLAPGAGYLSYRVFSSAAYAGVFAV